MIRALMPRCGSCSELTDSAHGENRCYNPLESEIGESDQSIGVDPLRDFCSFHSELRAK
jgi:hypothetical protein